jgi:hypothetical protein
MLAMLCVCVCVCARARACVCVCVCVYRLWIEIRLSVCKILHLFMDPHLVASEVTAC